MKDNRNVTMMKAEHLLFGVMEREALLLPFSDLTHGHFIGKTGYGKSTLLAYLATVLIWNNVNVGVIDPAGTLSRLILEQLVETGFYEKFPDAFDRFIYLDMPTAARNEQFLPYNILSGRYDPYTAADLVLKAFKRVWPALQDATSTNIELLTRLGSFVVAYHKLPLLPYLELVLVDVQLRKQLLERIDDQVIQRWFRDLGITSDTRIKEIVQTTLKRVYHISFAPAIRYALSQSDNVLNFHELIEKQRSFSLSLNIADEEAQGLFGALFTVHAETVSKERGLIARDTDRYVLILDEVQNLMFRSGQALATMFAEARKAHVSVWVAHQYFGQLPEEFQAALSQCGIRVAFQLSSNDAILAVDHLSIPIQPKAVKERSTDLLTPWNVRKTYYTPNEQREINAQSINTLAKRVAIAKLPNLPPTLMRTIKVGRNENAARVEQVEREYLRRYFRSKQDIDREVAQGLAIFSSPVQNDTLNPSNEHPLIPPHVAQRLRQIENQEIEGDDYDRI